MHTCVKNLLLAARALFSFLFLLTPPVYAQLRATPSAMSFGGQTVGATTQPATVMLVNGSSSRTFKIVSISSSSANFSLALPSLPATLAPGTALSVKVTFTAAAATSYSGTLRFQTRSGSTVKVPLSGTGDKAPPPSQGTVSFNSSLSFGTVAMGSTSVQTLSLSNSGSASLSISNISLTGPTVTLTGLSSGMVLAPGQSASVQTSFSPASTGSSNGTITIISNASNSPAVISWTATTPTSPPFHSVDLAWNASSSSGITGYHVYRGSASGGPYVLLTVNPVTATNFVDSTVSAAETLFYVVTSVATGDVESGYSNEVSATVP